VPTIHADFASSATPPALLLLGNNHGIRPNNPAEFDDPVDFGSFREGQYLWSGANVYDYIVEQAGLLSPARVIVGLGPAWYPDVFEFFGANKQKPHDPYNVGGPYDWSVYDLHVREIVERALLPDTETTTERGLAGKGWDQALLWFDWFNELLYAGGRFPADGGAGTRFVGTQDDAHECFRRMHDTARAVALEMFNAGHIPSADILISGPSYGTDPAWKYTGVGEGLTYTDDFMQFAKAEGLTVNAIAYHFIERSILDQDVMAAELATVAGDYLGVANGFGCSEIHLSECLGDGSNCDTAAWLSLFKIAEREGVTVLVQTGSLFTFERQEFAGLIDHALMEPKPQWWVWRYLTDRYRAQDDREIVSNDGGDPWPALAWSSSEAPGTFRLLFGNRTTGNAGNTSVTLTLDGVPNPSRLKLWRIANDGDAGPTDNYYTLVEPELAQDSEFAESSLSFNLTVNKRTAYLLEVSPRSGYAGELTDLSDPLASWTSSPIRWPADPFTPPPFTGDPANPAAWIDFEIRYEAASALTTNRAKIPGRMEFGIYIEPGPGADGLARELIDELIVIYAPADIDTASLFVRPYRARVEPSGKHIDEAGAEWHLTRWLLPFWRIE